MIGTIIAINNSMMKIAVSIWEKRVSPVFDVSKRFLIVCIENNQEIRRYEENISEDDIVEKSRYLIDLGAEMLICGAISRSYEEILLASGIQVVPEICGQVEDVIQAMISGELNEKKFLMPGCHGRRKRLHKGQGHTRWR
jgi:predicted Fe-Mo cluster-binding NifX family protein